MCTNRTAPSPPGPLSQSWERGNRALLMYLAHMQPERRSIERWISWLSREFDTDAELLARNPTSPAPPPRGLPGILYFPGTRGPPAPQCWGERRAARRDPKAARRTLPPALGGRGGLRPVPLRDVIQDKPTG